MSRYENTLTTLEEVLRLGNLDDPNDVALVKTLIRSASAQIEAVCDRVFVPYRATLGADIPLDTILMMPDDLLELDTLTISGTELTDGQYVLLDYNEWPKYAAVPTNLNTFLLWQNTPFQAIRMDGVWGYNTNPDGMFSDTGVTLAANATASATTLTVSALDSIETFSYIKVGDELIQVLGTSTHAGVHTLTVKRGVNGYAAAAHLSGVVVYIYNVPQIIYYTVANYVYYLYQIRDNFGERVQTGNGTVMLSKALPEWVINALANVTRVRFYTAGEAF